MFFVLNSDLSIMIAKQVTMQLYSVFFSVCAFEPYYPSVQLVDVLQGLCDVCLVGIV